jgi:O-antigen/teichoic acid export membrane protein
MSLFARLARDSLWLLIGRLGAQVSMIIVTYLLARRLGVPEFGEYSFMAGAIVVGNTLTTFGSDMYLIREIARQPSSVKISSALFLQLALSCLFIILIFLFAPHLPNQTSNTILALQIYCVALIPFAFFTVFTSMLRGYQKMDIYSWLNFAISVLQVIAILIFIPAGTSVVTLAWLLLIIQTVGAIFAWILCNKYIAGFRIIWDFSLTEVVNLFIACFPIALIAVMGILYQKLSLTMLSFLAGASMAGWFSAATRAVESARIGHIAALTALYPTMSKQQNEDSSRSYGLSWFLLILAACVAAFLLFFFAKPLVEIFFGLDYLPSIPVLKILSFTFLPYAVNSFLSLRFLAEKREKVIIYISLISLLILMSLNFWLIPHAGTTGAGWAVLTAEAIQSVLLLFVWRMESTLHSKRFVPQKGRSHELPDLS